MKRILKLIFIIVFIICLTVPVYTMPFFGEDTSAEKRELSSFPSLFSADSGLNENYTDELSAYLNEHFSFRSDFVTAWSLIQAKIFKTSTQDTVVVGKDDWLFFSETVPDYEQTNVFSEHELNSVIKTLDLINEYVEKNNGRFLFVTAPNKNIVYSQYMPYYIQKGKGSSNYSLLNSALADKEYYLNVLPLFENRDEQLYHKRDSHWNNLGAQICFSAVMDKLGRNHDDYEKINYTVKKNWRGDLDDMIFPSMDYLDDQVIYDKKFDFDYVSSFHSEDDLKIVTYNENGDGNLFMIRDSFTNALQPFFSDAFKNAKFTRILPCRLNETEAVSSDVVILELAERNLKEIINGAPVMEAPQRENIGNVEEVESNIFSEEISGMIHVYGTIPKTEKAGNIYIQASDGSIYEAFPIYETDLIKENNSELSSDEYYGFSAYLPYSEDAELNLKIFMNGE